MNPETEQLFEKLVVERGLVSPEAMAEARRAQASDRPGETQPLLNVLIDRKAGDTVKLRDLAQTAALRSGSERVVIGGFDLLEKIGQGGMGAVYRARQILMDRIVALKLMRPKLAKDTRHLERFLREAKASARLRHPNIVQGIDAGNDKGYYYFALEFVDGETLREVITREGALPEDECVDIGIQMARALEHASRFGMVHRDVKPANILIEKGTGVAKLADLGLAKSTEAGDTSVTQVGMAIGTPNYINPEQARGEREIDVRSDIYSLGATLYRAATGHLPFEGGSAPIIMSKHMSEKLVPPDERNPEVSAGFSLVIQRMMEKDREARYQTPTELLGDLERVSRGEQPAATLPKPAAARPARATGTPRSRPMIVLAGVAGAIALLAVVAVALGLFRREEGGGGGAGADAAILYTRAAQLARTEPTQEHFDGVLSNLNKCLALAPDGPRARDAEALKKAVQELRGLTQTTAKNPQQWILKAKALEKLAKSAPKDPPYGETVRAYWRSRAREHVAAAVHLAIAEPIRVPEASAWLQALKTYAPDTATAGEAAAKEPELAKILRDNSDHILATFAKRAESATAKRQFKTAAAIIRSSVPPHLVTPELQELIDKKVAVVHEAADRDYERLRNEVWALLDQNDAGQARDLFASDRDRLDLEHLRPKLDELGGTVDAADEFLRMFADVKQLEASVSADRWAVGKAVLAIRDRFPKDPYVAERLVPYDDLMRKALERGPVAAALKDVQGLIDRKEYAEADAAIDKLIAKPELLAAERLEAKGLRVRFGPEYVLVKRLTAGLPSHLPVTGIYLKVKGTGPLVRCNVLDVSTDGLWVETREGKRSLRWGELGAQAFYVLAFEKFPIIAKDDARGQYHLAQLLAGEKHGQAKELAHRAIELVEERPGSDVPGRATLLVRAHALLNRVLEDEAASALRQLADIVRQAEKPKVLEKALSAHDAFEREYGATRYVVEHADSVGEVEAVLAEALLEQRIVQIAPMVAKADWLGILARLAEAEDEAAAIGPQTSDRREQIAELRRFGRLYLAEATIYDQVFSVRPWKGNRLKALQEHADPLIARRAERYAAIFKVKVGRQKTPAAQLRYAYEEWSRRRKSHVWVSNVNTRLARYNGVFRHWPQARDQMAQAEANAAGDFAQTAIRDKKGTWLQNTGDYMLIAMAENFLRYRGDAGSPAGADMDQHRLNAYIRTAGRSRLLRFFVANQAEKAMREYRAVGDHPARFCLIAAGQHLALGSLTDAYKHYDRLCSSRSPQLKGYAWRGYLGRGRVRERAKKYAAAVSNYEKALARAKAWGDAYTCAKAITELCVHSGKYNRASVAKKAVNELLKRAGGGRTGARRRTAAVNLLRRKKE